MIAIAERLVTIRKEIPQGVTLVAVSKHQPVEAILEAYGSGQRVFGENRVQEMTDKYHHLPKDIEWHMIGHLQRNKVKYIVPFVSLIHSIDSTALLHQVNKEAAKVQRKIKVLLQFHIAQEQSKFGLSLSEAQEMLKSQMFASWKHIEVVGVMGMATFTDDLGQVREEFASLRRIFDHLRTEYFAHQTSFKEISMGMSGDYRIAIEEGSTMVRIGTSIFGVQ